MYIYIYHHIRYKRIPRTLTPAAIGLWRCQWQCHWSPCLAPPGEVILGSHVLDQAASPLVHRDSAITSSFELNCDISMAPEALHRPWWTDQLFGRGDCWRTRKGRARRQKIIALLGRIGACTCCWCCLCFFFRFVSDHVNVVCKIIQTPSVVDINIGICDGTRICDRR